MPSSELYQPYSMPSARSSLSMTTHLPYARLVLGRVNIGSPVHRAVRAADAQPPLAAAFAAHAHAFLRASVGEAIREYHHAAMCGLTLAVIAADNYPLARQDYVRLSVGALYEAATGQPYPETYPVWNVVSEDSATVSRGANVNVIHPTGETVQGVVTQVNNGGYRVSVAGAEFEFDFMNKNAEGYRAQVVN